MSAKRRRIELEAAARNRLDRHLAEVMQRRQTSTTEWVDPAYSARLASQLREAVKGAGPLPGTLRGVREWVPYVAEYPTRDGFDVWALDTSVYGDDVLMLVVFPYDSEGKLRRDEIVSPEFCERTVCITQHAAQRLYQRLRTNSGDDFKQVISILSTLEVAEDLAVGTGKTLEFPGFGRFHLVVDQLDSAIRHLATATGEVEVTVGDDPLFAYEDGRPIPKGARAMVPVQKLVEAGCIAVPRTWFVKTFIDARN